MGLFLQTVLFPGGKEADCRLALRLCATDRLLNLYPEDCRWLLDTKGPATLLNQGPRDPELLAARLSLHLPCPVMVLYLYDGDFWGYHLWRNGMEADRFASLPDYFEPGQPPKRSGSPRTVGDLMKASPERIRLYLAPWQQEQEGRCAYAADQFPIGDCWQMTDFMAALGFDYDRLAQADPAKEPEQPPDWALTPMAPPVRLPPQQAWPQAAVPQDTPELPNALTDRTYALELAKRLEKLDPAFQQISQLINQKEYQQAVQPLTQAIQAQPGEAALYLLRAFCWNQLEGKGFGRSRKPDMDRDLSQALELEPDNILALRGRCPTAATTIRYQRHIQDLTRLIELDPENMDLYLVSRAYRFHWVGDDRAAREDLEWALHRGKLWTVDLTYLCRELGIPGM